MALTAAQLARAEAAEERQRRIWQLAGLDSRELHALLSGDPGAAAPWVRSAAEWGLAAAQLRLGRMLLGGHGVGRDAAAAFAWFSRAAAQGDAEAMNMVGRCHENGWGVPLDLARAAAHYRDSAGRGHDWGEYNFAHMLFDGRGIGCDRREALLWYLRAARQGHSRAMNLLGRCYEEGWGCAADPAQAALWYRRSAHRGYFRGQFNHAAVLAQRGEAQAAAYWYGKAAQTPDAAIRRAILIALVNAVDPHLLAVRARIAALLPQATRAGASPRYSTRGLTSGGPP